MVAIKHRDFTNNRFGALTALYRSQRKHDSEYAYWTCRCDCGNLTDVTVYSLNSGTTKSCGCQLLRKQKTNVKESVFKKVATDYKHKAKKRGIEWNLSQDQVFKLIDRNCHYCGIEPSNTSTIHKQSKKAKYSGIDRINNNIGYVEGNVVPCCAQCNYAKMGMSDIEFKNWIEAVYRHMFNSH